MLGIYTERGQRGLRDEMEMASHFERLTGIQYQSTDKDSICCVDAVLTKSGQLCGIVETKPRYDFSSAEEFYTKYKGQWLVTNAKIINCRKLADMLYTPFFGIIYIPASKEFLIKRIYEKGRDLVNIEVKNSFTIGRHTDVGKVERSNAFIDMTGAKKYRLTD